MSPAVTGLLVAWALAQPVAAPPPPGPRSATGTAAIEGGNMVVARDRALSAALARLVEDAIADLATPGAGAPDPKAIEAVTAKARRYVLRYRILESGDSEGSYRVTVEGEVSRRVLRRDLDAVRATVGQAGERPNLLVIPSGKDDPTAALVAALSGPAMSVEVGRPGPFDAGAAAATARAGKHPAALLVRHRAGAGASLRGIERTGVSVELDVQLVPATGPAGAVHTMRRWGFAAGVPAARADGLGQAAAAAAEVVGDEVTALIASDGAGARSVTVEAKLEEPDAIFILLRTLRDLSAVSAVEPRLIDKGSARIRVASSQPAASLAKALVRDARGRLVLTEVEIAGDVVRVTVAKPSEEPSMTDPTP